MAAHVRREGHGDVNGHGEINHDAAVINDRVQQSRLARPLGPGEEERLLHQAAIGDRTSQDRLVSIHLATVVRLAGARADRRLSIPDLVQEGSIGLLLAVRSFAGSGELDFADFAERTINAHMEAALDAEAAAVHDAELLVAAATDYERTEMLMRQELDREPLAPELAEKLEWTVDRTLYVAQVVAGARRRYDQELLAFIDPASMDFDDDERVRLDG